MICLLIIKWIVQEPVRDSVISVALIVVLIHYAEVLFMLFSAQEEKKKDTDFDLKFNMAIRLVLDKD